MKKTFADKYGMIIYSFFGGALAMATLMILAIKFGTSCVCGGL